MSYGTLYKLEWTDYFDQAAELLIQEDGYAGAVTEVEGAGNPFSMTFDTPSDFKIDPINGSYAKIRLMTQTDFEFVNLYTNSNRKYKVIYNVDGSLYWTGFILPDQYQEQYKGPPYVNEFIAADQLGFLKVIAWDREDVETEITTLGAILAKTNLDLDLWEGLNIYEDAHSSTTADSPLDQTYINAKVFDGKTYYDALYGLLFKYAGVILQDRGKWFIWRPEDATASFTRRLWTYSAGVFTYDSNESHNPIVSTTSAPPATAVADLVRIANRGKMFIDAAWKSYTLTQNYDKIENALLNGGFTEWNGVTLESWTQYGAFTYYQESNSVRINGLPGRTSERFAQRINCNHNRALVSASWEVYVNKGDTMNITVRIKRQIVGQPTPLYWDFDNGEWTYGPPNPYFNKEYDNSAGANALIESGNFEFTAWHSFNYGTTEYLEIELYVPIGTATSYLRWKEVKVEYTQGGISDNDSIPFPEETVHDIEINPDNNADGGSFDMLLSDMLQHVSLAYLGFVYNGGLWLDSGQLMPTRDWTASGITGTLVSLLQNSLSKMYSDPTQVLSVMIYSKLLFSSSVIQEINNDNKLFMVKRATLDAKFGRWQVEAHEIPSEDVVLIDESDDIWIDENDNELTG